MSTQTILFTFDTTVQGWTFIDTGGPIALNGGWDGTSGNAAGSIKLFSPNTSGSGSANGYAKYTLTWTDFGIPSNATISSVTFSVDENIQVGTQTSATSGGYYFYSTVNGTPLYTLLSSRNATTADTSYVNRSQATTISSVGTDSFELRCYVSINLNTQVNLDNIKLVVTYTTPSSGTSINSNFPLYIRGFSSLSGTTNLYTRGLTNANNNETLYTKGFATLNGIVNMFAQNTPNPTSATCCSGESTFDSNTFDYTCACSINNIVNMFIKGNFGATNTTNLFTSGKTGSTAVNNNVNLFARGLSTTNSSANLFVGGFSKTSINNNSNLFIKGIYKCCGAEPQLDMRAFDSFCSCLPVNKLFNMFIKGGNLYNTTNLFINGSIPNKTGNLFTRGYSITNSNFPINIHGDWDTSPNSGVNLYVGGAPYNPNTMIQNLIINGSNGINTIGNRPLFIHGDSLQLTNKQLPLFLKGPGGLNSAINLVLHATQPISKNATLFINSSINTDKVNYIGLYMSANPGKINYNATRLVVNGSTGKGLFTNRNLFVQGGSLVTPFDLYVKGADSSGHSQIFNLWINGTYNNKSFPLFVCNTQSEVDNFSWMYISGFGYNATIPGNNGNIGLFIQRGPNGGMTMFIKNDTYSQPMYIRGFATLTNSTTTYKDLNVNPFDKNSFDLFSTTARVPVMNCVPVLFTQGFLPNNTTNMFIAGNIPQGLNGNTTLVIPKTYGFPKAESLLYTHGFYYNS